MSEVAPTILIVDDNPTNLKVLFDYLAEQHYKVLVAEDGEAALEQAQRSQPDLILLDVLMPGIDGFETCRRLKASPQTRDMPVIFMTALTDTQYIIKGFEAGGVDYLTKPLNQEEVNVRVRNHVSLRRLQRELEAEVKVRREAEAALYEINKGKDQFFSILAHDLKRPLHQMLLSSGYLEGAVGTASLETLKEISSALHQSAKSMGRLCLDLLGWAQLQMGQLELKPRLVDLQELVDLNLALANLHAAEKKIQFRNELKEQIFIYADGRMIDTVLRNLMSNAVKFTPPGGTVWLSAEKKKDEVIMTVRDSGIGIAPEKVANLFVIGKNRPQQGTAGEEGTGLGLPLCYQIIMRNHGRMWVEAPASGGAAMKFSLPAQKPT
jgi:two-component system sensor histidine kinase/response regulator